MTPKTPNSTINRNASTKIVTGMLSLELSRGFWIPRRGFWIPGRGLWFRAVDSGFRAVGSGFRAVDSGFRSVDSGFHAVDSTFFVSDPSIPDSMSCIPDSKPRIPVSTRKNFPDSGIPILLHDAIDFSGLDGRFLSIYIQLKWRVWFYNFFHLYFDRKHRPSWGSMAWKRVSQLYKHLKFKYKSHAT